MQQHGRQAAGSSRRIGGGAPTVGNRQAFQLAPVRGWLLKLSAFAFVWPLFLALVRGSGAEAIGLVTGIVLLYVGAKSIERGSREEALNEGRPLAQSPTPGSCWVPWPPAALPWRSVSAPVTISA